MNPRDLLALILSNLARMKGRVLMPALGVVVGTGAVVVLISLGAGLQRQALDSLGSGAQEVRITGGIDMTVGLAPVQSSSAVGAQPRIVDAALLARVRALPGVARVVVSEPVAGPLDVVTGRMCVPSMRVVGLEPEDLPILGFEAASGELSLGRGQALIGSRVSETLARSVPQRPSDSSDGDLVGQVLTLYLSRRGEDGTSTEKAVRLEVAGQLAPRGSSYDFAIYVPRREALALNAWFFGQRRDPDRQGHPEVLVRAEDVRHVAAIEAQLVAMGLNVFSAREQAESLGEYFNELQALLGGIAAISLLVSAFSIANTMLMAIVERTREIGLMKAVGASNGDVMWLFLGEAGTIGLLGGVGGVLAGLGINALVNLVGGNATLLEQMFGSGTVLRASTPVWLPFFTVGFAIVVGIASGAYPARRAARMSPIAALKVG